MSTLHSILVLLAAIVAVFVECTFGGFRHLLGAQIDFLPAIVVYAALRTGLVTMSVVATLGGLCFDSLSANPIGISVLPLFIPGFVIYLKRELILQDQLFAQCVIGLCASAVTPALTLLLLLTSGHTPLLGWGSPWQWIVMSLGGAIATPILFVLFDWFEQALSYRRTTEASFRPDREIRRGRK